MVEWVPILDVPLPRRKQTLGVLFQSLIFGWGYLLCPMLYVYLLISTRLWWLMLLYGAWMLYDQKKPKMGARPWTWVRRWSVWTHFANFFPIHVEKTIDLDPDRRYIFGYHPHGIASLGAMGTFCTDAVGFHKVCPGIRTQVCTLASNFWIPFRREILLWLGIVDVSRESIEYLLTKGRKGTAVVIVVGGAQEALDARPGEPMVTLKNRKGFAKMALKYGADLVPVFSFGENELFIQVDNPEGSKLRNFQIKFKELLGFSPPIFHGRGIFNYTYGFLPYRTPMHIVVGKPISVEQVQEPTVEQVNELHTRYIKALEEVFETNKQKYGVPENVNLVIA